MTRPPAFGTPPPARNSKASAHLAATPPGHLAAYSPDGKFIVTASYDQTARIWDAATGQELEGVSPLSGHTNGVTSAAYSPDGKFIVTASWDQTARIWDAATGQELEGVSTGPVTSAAYSPDGKFIVTASDDQTARIWVTRHRPGTRRRQPA